MQRSEATWCHPVQHSRIVYIWAHLESDATLEHDLFLSELLIRSSLYHLNVPNLPNCLRWIEVCFRFVLWCVLSK